MAVTTKGFNASILQNVDYLKLFFQSYLIKTQISLIHFEILQMCPLAPLSKNENRPKFPSLLFFFLFQIFFSPFLPNIGSQSPLTLNTLWKFKDIGNKYFSCALQLHEIL